MATTRAMLERRRASRIRIHVRVTVFRDAPEGESAETPALAVGISRCGALLRLPFVPQIGSRIRVLNESTRESRDFRVIRVGAAKPDGTHEIGVEILHPQRNFWGVQFPDEPADDALEAADLALDQFPRR